MKSTVLGILTGLFLFIPPVHGQGGIVTFKDSVNTLYDKLFEELEENYLHADKVDWPSVKSYIKKEALKSATFQESLATSVKLFDTVQGNHLLLFAEKDWYKSTLGKQLAKDDFNQSLLDAYSNSKGFETKVIDNHYGYIFIPGMLLKDATQEELDQAAQKIYDAVLKVDKSNDLKGWIIDLRLNIGGNSNVMLSGLYHLLGNGTVLLDLDSNKNVKTLTSFVDGVLYHNHKVINTIETTSEPKAKIPVALISGILTNSAGEFVLLGFRGRENTSIIGEESYGSTTANDLYELPFGIKAAITESYGTDRSAQFTKTVVPDIEVIKQTNFEDLLVDKNIIEAIRFIESKQ